MGEFGWPSGASIQWLICRTPGLQQRRAHGPLSRDCSKNGEVASGAAAFVHLWAQLQVWRHMARLARRSRSMAKPEEGKDQF